MNQKHSKNIVRVNVDVNLNGRRCKSTKNGIIVSVNVSVKNQQNTLYVKKIMPGTLSYMPANVTRIVTLVN